MNQEQYAENMRQAVADGMVKVGIPCEYGPVNREWCWAKRLSSSFAKLDNCCVYRDDVYFGDVVEFCERDNDHGGPHPVMKSFVRVVSRGSTQLPIAYGTAVELADRSDRMRAEFTDRFRTICAFCDAMPIAVRPVCVEGFVAGIAHVAFPATVTIDEARALAAGIPFAVDDDDQADD